MLHKSAKINLEEPGLAVEAKEFIVIQFVIFGAEWFDFSLTIRYLPFTLWHYLEGSANHLICYSILQE